MNAPEIKVSIVVPAYNEAANLPGLFDTLEDLRVDSRIEIIVVDNGSRDATAAIARARGADVVGMERSPVGAGRNVGAKRARGELIAFLDADVLVTTEWCNAVRKLAERGNLAVLTGDVYDIVDAPSWIEHHWFRAHYSRGARRYINGGNLIISRDSFLKVGGFDESMIAGEDVEFCKRAANRGIPVQPDRNLRVLHKGYPGTISEFILREAWHGRSDFVSLRSIVKTPVAVLTGIFVLLHVLALIALLLGEWFLSAVAAGGVVLLCLVCSMWKWQCVSVGSRLVNAVVFYFYFIGRAIAGWRDTLGRLRR